MFEIEREAQAKNTEISPTACGARHSHCPKDLRHRLEYDPETGKMRWKNPAHNLRGRALSIWKSRYLGKEAFTATMPRGYRQGRIDRVAYLAHRVAWALHYGSWPDGVIDHINGCTADNRIENLRDVSQAENVAASLASRGAKC